MDFFGFRDGFSNPIKDMLRDDYQEPKTPNEGLKIKHKGDHKDFVEKVKELDCYLGYTDGYSYSSLDRLSRMRKKHVIKPDGPTDMFKYPGANSMNYGWWANDPVLNQLDEERNWFKPIRNGIITSEMSRFANTCLKINKFYKM